MLKEFSFSGIGLVLIAYFVFINLLLMLLMGIDKYKAKHHKWRIPESTLLAAGLAGGGIGGLLGMFLFRHKTKKLVFYIVYALGIVVLYFTGYKLA